MFDLNPSDDKLVSMYGMKTIHPTTINDINYKDFNAPEDLSDLTTEQQYNLLIDIIDSDQPQQSSNPQGNVLLDIITNQESLRARNNFQNSFAQAERQIQDQNSQLTKAISENFVYFINTKQKVDDTLVDFIKSKTKAQQDRLSSRVFNPQRRSLTNREGLTSELEDNISNLMNSTSLMIQPINESKHKEDKVAKMLEFIKMNQHFFDLPQNLVHSLSLNKNEKFIDDYNRYINDKDRFLANFNNRFNEQQAKLTNENNTQALKVLEEDRVMKLTLISKIFEEVDTIAQQYRNKIYQEFLSLDHEVTKSQNNSKFISLVDNLSKLNLDDKMANPIADFLSKQVEAIDKDFEHQVGKFDSKFLLMQNKLVDYIRSLNPERREGSHINYINEKYDTYRDEINLVDNFDQKLRIIREAFESNDSLDLSLINETWLVLYNFINYLDSMLMANMGKYLTNYVHYVKMGIDPTGEIRDSCIKLINQVVLIMVALFDDENNDNNQLESSPKNYKQFVPYYSNSLSSIYHLTRISEKVNKIMNSFGDLVGTIGNASKYADTNKVIKNLKNSSIKVNQKILEAVCATWVNDCSQFYELEDWSLDKEKGKGKYRNSMNNGKCTKLMNVIQYYQLYVLVKISKLVIHDSLSSTPSSSSTSSTEYKIVATYPSKRMLVSIEIQFMRSLNIIVDSMMKKYNLDRQDKNNDDSKNLQVFKILTMNNFDILSRIIYPELLSQFDKLFDKDLSHQNLKLFADIDKASLTIIEDILNIEKLYIAQHVNKFFHNHNNNNNNSQRLQVMKVDGFIYEILIHFVKLINKIKPLTSQEIFISVINELQLNLLKNIIDNVRQSPLKSSLSYVNLKLDANFILSVFEKSSLLQLNDACYKYLQILLNDIDTKNNEMTEKYKYSQTDFNKILELSLQDSSNEFSCF